jgi:hypothetical protein
MRAFFFMFLVAASLPGAADAHKPFYSLDGEYSGSDAAYVVEDLDMSIVLYHQVFCGEGEQLWMEFEATPGQEIYMQVGVPLIERLAAYRPDLALLAPGLPEPTGDLPFEVPEGLGVLHFPGADSTDEVEVFYEPFTQTESWMLHESTRTLEEGGSGYLVAWHPDGATGKLWVATGTEERFGSEDFDNMGTWITETRAFHETGEDGATLEVNEEVCAVPEESAAGCSAVVSAGSSRSAWWALGLPLVGSRLRRRSAPCA